MSDGSVWRDVARFLLSDADEEPQNQSDAQRDGMQFGDYVLEKEVARGGMGIVYRAWQISLARQVAVKVMREGLFADGRETERFLQEAAAAAALRHPGIVPVFESGECEGRMYYTMEWIAGENLAEATREHPAGAQQAARWVRAVAETVQHAHEQGVVHRDLKPANVILDDAGNPRLTDFGMARRADAASGLTLTGQILGTPGYMAPEAAGGSVQSNGAAADIYGLGAVLFHLLTCRAPHIGESHTAILRQVMEDDPISPRLLNPAVPRDLETICLKALSREPARRYLSAGAMADDLRRLLEGSPVLARPVTGLERAWRWCRRKPALAASLAAIAILLVTVAAVSIINASRLEKARQAESLERGRAEAGRRQARTNLYAADVRMAGQLYEKGALESARRLLAGHIPEAGTEDFRGFDWHYLDSKLNGEQLSKQTLPVAPEGDDMPVSADGLWALLVNKTQASLVNLETRKIAAEWTEARSPGFFLRSVFWSGPAHRVVVTGGDRVRLIDPDNGSVEFLGTGGAECAALTGDGRRLAFGPARSGFAPAPARIDFWDLPSRMEAGGIALSAGPRALAWLPDGETIIAGVAPRSFQWWKPGAPEPLKQIALSPAGEASNMPWAWISPDGSLAAVPWWDSEEQISVYGLSDGHLAGRLTGLSRGSARMAWSADSQWLAGSGSEQSILLFRRDAWNEPEMLRGPMGLTGGLAFPRPGALLSVSADQTVRWWQAPPQIARPVYPNDMTGSHVWRPAWSPDGTLVTMAARFGINGDDHSMRGVLWDCVKQSPRFEWDEIGLAFSPDSRSILTVERNAVYRVRDTGTGKEIKQFTLEREGGFRLPRVSPDGRWMVVWHDPSAALLYDMSTGRSVAALSGGAEAAFSPDSKRLARETGRRLAIRDLPSGAEEITEVPCHIGIAWSPDGNTIASRFDGDVHLVGARTRKLIATLPGQTSRVGVMLFLPDGRTLLTTTEDGAARLWNLPAMRETVTLATLTSCAFYCAVSPDGRSVLAGGSGGYTFFSLPGAAELKVAARSSPAGLVERTLWTP